MDNKKKIFFVVILTIIISSLCITTFAIEPNKTTYSQGVSKVFSNSAFLNPSFALIYGNADEDSLYTTSIDIVDDVYDLQYGEITTTQYLKNYTHYWDVPFRPANDVMNDVATITEEFWNRRSYLLGETFVDIGNSTLYASIRLPTNGNAEYELGEDVTQYNIVLDNNETLILALSRDMQTAYVAEINSDGIFLAPLIVYDGFEDFVYTTTDIKFTKKATNEYPTFWEQYFVDVKLELEEVVPIDIRKRVVNDDVIYLENTLKLPYEYCYIAPNANGYYQVRMKIRGGNEAVLTSEVERIFGDTFIVSEQNCKVEYYVKYSYLKTSINLYGQKIATLETKEYRHTITDTQGANIAYSPKELIDELKRMVNVDYVYIEDYELMLYCRRYTVDKPISVYINYNNSTDGIDNLTDIISQYTLYEQGSAIVDGLPDNDIVGFLNNTARAVLSTPLLYNLSLGMIVSIPIAIAVVMWVLKVFAGG